MGSVHQSAELLYIVFLQCLYRTDGTAVLINRMLRALSAHITLNNGSKLFKGLFIQLAQSLNLHNLLQFSQRCFTFATSFIVLGISQTSLLIAARNYNLCSLQGNRRIFIGKSCRIQKNRIVLLSHGNRKLIHNTAVYLIEFIFGILSNQCQILICHIKAKEIP